LAKLLAMQLPTSKPVINIAETSATVGRAVPVNLCTSLTQRTSRAKAAKPAKKKEPHRTTLNEFLLDTLHQQ